jgi:hypothetical protein
LAKLKGGMFENWRRTVDHLRRNISDEISAIPPLMVAVTFTNMGRRYIGLSLEA